MRFLLFILIVNVLFLLGIWGYCIVSYSELPEVIPTHFDLTGKADGYGSKNMIWAISLVPTALFLFLFYISKNTGSPLLNIPEKLRQNKYLAELFVQVMIFIVLLVFWIILYETVNVALGSVAKISNVIFVPIGLIFLVLIGFSIYAKKIEKS